MKNPFRQRWWLAHWGGLAFGYNFKASFQARTRIGANRFAQSSAARYGYVDFLLEGPFDNDPYPIDPLATHPWSNPPDWQNLRY